MGKDSIILAKTYAFALKIIETYKFLRYTHKEFEMSKQLLRAGTSMGANAEEADGAPTKKDFANKFSIAYKECRETHYWIRLLRDSNYIERHQAQDLLDDCEEINRILSSILKSTRDSLS
jgi:four helix bundle protein